MTPHNEAKLGDIAKTVIMPGDPLRAKMIAETYLTNPRIVNNVRGIQGYTGTYKGKEITVMASGMGIPSISIYSYELFNFYNVDKIIRVGSCGGINNNLKIGDIVIGLCACSESSYAKQFIPYGNVAACASYNLAKKAEEISNKNGYRTFVGPILSSDTFYSSKEFIDNYKNIGVLAVEMEAYALYLNALKSGKEALSILTVSDIPFSTEVNPLSAEDRQNKLKAMIEVALEL